MECAEEVTGLKRKLGEFTTEVVRAEEGAECRKDDVLGLEVKVEAITEELDSLEVEKCNVRKIGK